MQKTPVDAMTLSSKSPSLSLLSPAHSLVCSAHRREPRAVAPLDRSTPSLLNRRVPAALAVLQLNPHLLIPPMELPVPRVYQEDAVRYATEGNIILRAETGSGCASIFPRRVERKR